MDGQDLQKEMQQIRQDVRGRADHPDIKYTGKRGQDVYITLGDEVSFHKLTLMELQDVLFVLGLTHYDLRCHLDAYRRGLEKKVLSYFRQRWFWRSDDSIFSFSEYCLETIPMTVDHIRRALKRQKSGISINQSRNPYL